MSNNKTEKKLFCQYCGKHHIPENLNPRILERAKNSKDLCLGTRFLHINSNEDVLELVDMFLVDKNTSKHLTM